MPELVTSSTPPAASASTAGDCDDGNGAVFPGNSEAPYNGLDDDCDPATPDDDLDADGHALATDCDDQDPSVNPDVLEVCNGKDDDCDGEIDEDAAVDVATWYADSDGDGFGDSSTSEEGCEAPLGYVDNDEDCDDSEASSNPDASERCDGADNDCDGEVDEDSLDADEWYPDEDGDGYGD